MFSEVIWLDMDQWSKIELNCLEVSKLQVKVITVGIWIANYFGNQMVQSRSLVKWFVIQVMAWTADKKFVIQNMAWRTN